MGLPTKHWMSKSACRQNTTLGKPSGHCTKHLNSNGVFNSSKDENLAPMHHCWSPCVFLNARKLKKTNAATGFSSSSKEIFSQWYTSARRTIKKSPKQSWQKERERIPSVSFPTIYLFPGRCGEALKQQLPWLVEAASWNPRNKEQCRWSCTGRAGGREAPK